MHRMLGFTLLLAAIVTPAMAVGKIVVDPNISKMPSVTDQEAATNTDKRLSQKVTYTGGYKRLNTVVSDLSKASGVHLYCGKTPQDWQVRDIPVIVYAKDIPLEKLLRAIADGTHTLFITQKAGSKDEKKEPAYRICRNAKTADSIAKRMEDRYYAKFAEAEWGWDALAAFGKAPNLDKTNIGIWAPGFSTVLAFLSEEDKKKVFSGESIVVNTETAPQIADALRDLYKNHAPSGCPPEDMAKGEMRISLHVVGESDLQYLIGEWLWHDDQGSEVSSGYPIPRCADALKNAKGFNLPPRPPSELPQPEEDCPKDRLRILKTNEDWELPSLKTKLKLEAPKDKERPAFSDAVIAIAKASGFNIICEDFQSQQKAELNPLAQDFYAGDITLGEALKRLYCYRSKWLSNENGNYEPTWLINEKDKLIIGWANEWREHHYYLVQESLISSICNKMNGEGAQLDDFLPVLSLTRRQRLEWINNSEKDIWAIDLWMHLADSSVERSVWKLYAALSDTDRKLVKSDAGLSLSKFDPAWLISFFSDTKGFEVPYTLSDSEKEQAKMKMQLKKELLTDPKQIATLVMRMPPDSTEYNIELVGEKNGEKVVLNTPGGRRSYFPVYSQKRKEKLNGQGQKVSP